MELINQFFSDASSMLWGWPMIILLLGTHIYLTVVLRVPQRKLFTAMRLSVKTDRNASGDVSQFGALTTALAATIGTGNIIGVATAVALGGPGAVLWCWLTGVFGIATKYAEGLLAVKYRVKRPDGQMLGGPMYALERGLGWKWLAVLFAVFTAIAAFGIGNTVQANAISTLADKSYGISPYISGAILCALTAAVVLGGVKSIARVCGALVPFMSLFYVLGCIYILIVNGHYLMPALRIIIDSAFSPQAAGGGFLGSTVIMAARFGIARGLFRYFLGHRGDLRAHGNGDCEQYHRPPRHLVRRRGHAHPGGIQQNTPCRHSLAHTGTDHFCLQHHPRMVLLRRKRHGISQG